VKQLFGQIASLSARTQAAEQRIHDRAVEREAEVDARLEQLRPLAMTDEGSGKEYQTLVLERAKLAQVVGMARVRLTT